MRAWRMAPALGIALILAPKPAPAQLAPGDVLVTSLATGQIYRLRPSEPAPMAPVLVPTGGAITQPRGLGVGRDGLLLVAESGFLSAPKLLFRVDPASDRRALVAQFSSITSTLRGVAPAKDGRVFVADPGAVPITEPPLTPIRGITFFPVIAEVGLRNGVPAGGVVAGCSAAIPGVIDCGHLFFPSAVAIASDSPQELILLVADAGRPDPSAPGRIDQAVVRVFPDRPLDPGINDEIFCDSNLFATPRALAIDRSPGHEGSVLVTDSGDATLTPPREARIFRVPAAGCEPDGSIETVASGSGLLRPVGIAVADDGTLYVADNLADTVFRIDPGSGIPTALSTPGSVDGAWDLQIYAPDPSELFVADAATDEVLGIVPGATAPCLLASGGSLLQPAGLSVLDATLRKVVVADTGSAAVIAADAGPHSCAPPGAQTIVSQDRRLKAPTSASPERGGTSYLVTDRGDALADPAVIRVDPSSSSPDNQSLVAWGNLLVEPVAGAVASDGRLIVLDAGSDDVPARLLAIDPDPEPGVDPQSVLYSGLPLRKPVAIALDPPDGTLVVADAGNPSADPAVPPAVFRFVSTPTGLVPLTVTADGDLDSPAGVAVDIDRSILVSSGPSGLGPIVRVDALTGLQTGVPDAGAGLQEPTGIGITSDLDFDGVADTRDNCLGVINADQENLDGDPYGNACDPDDDGDGSPDPADGVLAPDKCPKIADDQGDGDADGLGDACDNCPEDANPDQANSDTDTLGDACDDDGDLDDDGILDGADNCPVNANAHQDDADMDGVGDACDDQDGDAILDLVDNCAGVFNPDQTDTNADAVGDFCDDDDDEDTILDAADNCSVAANANQTDSDGDGFGDACDTNDDRDGDMILDAVDNCVVAANTNQSDPDGDGRGDACDNCPTADNPDQANSDTDALGNACDDNDDGDTILDASDNCPVTANESQGDLDDGDGIGSACDKCRTLSNADQLDADGDGFGDACDNCSALANDQRDTNGDGIGNACDADYDDDGVIGGTDLRALGRAFGAVRGGAGPAYDEDVDGNGDGAIGGPELLLLFSSFGDPPGPSGRCPSDGSSAGCPPAP